MKVKESRREIKRQNRTVTSIYYYTDNGRELAFYTDDGRGEAYSKVLYFNADLMAVQSHGMTYIERAKPEYMDDFRKVEALHPGIPQSEFTNI